jgi:zinc transport system substrate-binding protein
MEFPMRNLFLTATFALLPMALLPMAGLADVPRVVTDILPVHSLTARVMQGVGTPDLLVPAGASPHHFTLKPSQAGALQDADLVIWVGHGLAPWLEGPLDALAGRARIMELAPLSPVQRDFREGSAFAETESHGDDHGSKAKAKAGHDHGHDHDHDHDHDHATDATAKAEAADGHDDHDHSGLDPHVWLDPSNARAWVGLIATELAQMDPANAAAYAANATAADAELALLETDMTALLTGLAGRPYVVFHNAYGYLEGRFGLTPAGAISVGDASPPSAARLATLQAAIVDQGVICAFSEPEFDDRLIAAVAGDKAKIAVLDTFGAAQTPGPDLYPATMRALAQTLADCLNP